MFRKTYFLNLDPDEIRWYQFLTNLDRFIETYTSFHGLPDNNMITGITI